MSRGLESRPERSDIPQCAALHTWGARTTFGTALTSRRPEGETATVAGYSGTALPRKLGIKPNSRLALVSPPPGFLDTLGPLPDGVRLRDSARGRNDVILFFATRQAELARRFPKLANGLDVAGGLWIAWPKRASGVVTDLTERIVRDIGLGVSLVDNKVCAVDDIWSGLRFVYRLQDRPARGAKANRNGHA